jgi:hypothetical protein
MPIDASAVEKGYLVPSDRESDTGQRITLHFNPTTLTYSLEASTAQQNQPNRTGQAQNVSQFSAKLSFDAIFDNTDNGDDVRVTTNRIAQLLQPSGASQDSGNNAPPLVVFHWGAFRFTGVLNQYRETIDFFAKEGVPLRSTVSLTLVKQDKALELEQGATGSRTPPTGSLVPTRASDSALSAATRGGDPRAARALAASNGLESLRFTGGVTLEVGGGGAQASLGLTGPSGGDASASWNASGTGSLFGGQSSAGVSASAGAFAGLSARGGASAQASLDPGRMLGGGAAAEVSVHAAASFSVGGSALMEASAGLSADVGARASWRDLLRFDDEG